MLDFISELARNCGGLSCPQHPPTGSPRQKAQFLTLYLQFVQLEVLVPRHEGKVYC